MLSNKQYKMLKFILRNKRLGKITKKFGMDYLSIQYFLPTGSLIFSDRALNDSTLVSLTTEAEKEVEEHRRKKVTIIVAIITAISTAITAILSIASHLIK